MMRIDEWLNKVDREDDESKHPEIRLECLWNTLAVIDDLEWTDARPSILFAYGLIDIESKETTSEEIKKEEVEFAKQCLNGKGGNLGEYMFKKPSLISVLAMEYGLLKMYDSKAVSRPWFGGDWISMAELIIHICRGRNARSTFSKGPRDLIRIYRVEWDRDNSDNVYGANFSLFQIFLNTNTATDGYIP